MRFGKEQIRCANNFKFKKEEWQDPFFFHGKFDFPVVSNSDCAAHSSGRDTALGYCLCFRMFAEGIWGVYKSLEFSMPSLEWTAIVYAAPHSLLLLFFLLLSFSPSPSPPIFLSFSLPSPPFSPPSPSALSSSSFSPSRLPSPCFLNELPNPPPSYIFLNIINSRIFFIIQIIE